MALEILRDIGGLRIEVLHQPDADGLALVEHLRRIGCRVDTVWPMPEEIAPTSDIVVLAVDHDSRAQLQRLFRASGERPAPTLIAIVGYENPSILQLVLEMGAHAVIERPVRPFGMLTQLAIARSLWLRQQNAARRVEKLERKLGGIQKIQRARAILMENQGLSEEDAYQTIRRQAMSKRMPMEDMAAAIIAANEVLNSKRGGD